MSGIEESHLNLCAIKTCKYILNESIKKLPIKFPEITKNCLDGDGKLLADVIALVRPMLEEIYGIELRELRLDKAGKSLLCTSKLSISTVDYLKESDKVQTRLLFIVLSMILMRKSPIRQETLFAFLKKAGIEEDDQNFGDVRKHISDTFVRQLYLQKEVAHIGGDDMKEIIQYSWGQRADLEFDKEQVIAAVSTILEDPDRENDENQNQFETSDIEMDE